MSVQQDITRPAAPAGRYDHLAPVLLAFSRLDITEPGYDALRDGLVTGFRPVVIHIAGRYRGRGEPTDDLQQVGTLGLLKALHRFVLPPGVDDVVGAFLGYAIPTVTGEIRRHFRDRTWSMRVPRRLKDLQGPIRDAADGLSRELRRAPKPSEIAARIGIGVDEVIEALSAQRAYTPESLDALPIPDRTPLGERLGRLDDSLDRVEHSHELRKGLDALSERDRRMVLLRFFADMTQTQIAAELGISQMHVSRMLSRALSTLRRKMDAA